MCGGRKTVEESFEVRKASVLTEIFSVENVRTTIKRIYNRRDKDDLVTHPLKAVLLVEYRDQISDMISRLVPEGRWSPNTAYTCLVPKRSGSYRELVFPNLIDSIVGRRVIDALEPYITEDDSGRTFCGRSHANSTRAPGDYEDWFAVWQDYTAAIADAAKEAGFTYVFETDVSDFFPSIDRGRAKQYLAERTGAHSSVLELLFYCLETWLPRFRYSAMAGIPIENNDVSRLVAHNYLKFVDKVFVDDPDCRYLRYVDDTVVFLKSRREAEHVKREHHLALRHVGLSPNAGKTRILPVETFEAERHPEFNERIDRVKKYGARPMFTRLVEEWYEQNAVHVPNWDRVTKRLYTAAHRWKFEDLRVRVLADLEHHPVVAPQALKYLRNFSTTQDELGALFRLCRRGAYPELGIHIAKFISETRFAFDASETIADFATYKIKANDERHGVGHEKGHWLLALHKHGKRRHREQITKWGSVETLAEEQLRLHFLYVFFCCHELESGLMNRLRHFSNPDIDLMLQLCIAAKDGTLTNSKKILGRCLGYFNGARVIEARYLPLLRLMLGCDSNRRDSATWLADILQPKRAQLHIRDPVVVQFLRSAQRRLLD